MSALMNDAARSSWQELGDAAENELRRRFGNVDPSVYRAWIDGINAHAYALDPVTVPDTQASVPARKASR